MKLEDVTALARAGFTAQQITAFMQLDKAPAAVPTQALAAVPTQALAAVPTQASAAVPTQALAAVPTQASAAVPTQAPAAVPTQAPAAVLTQASAAVPTQASAAVLTQAPAAEQPKTFDDIYKAIAALQTNVQASNLLAAQQAQSAQPDADQIIANIINPPTMHKEA